jgi:hypothetical protein
MTRYKVELKWTCIFAAVCIAWALIGKVLGFDGQQIRHAQIFNTFIMVPTLVIYLLSALDKRDRCYNGQITFKQAVISGIILSVGITVSGIFTTVISTQLISPELFANNIQYHTAQKLMTHSEAVAQFNLQTFIVTGIIAALLMGIVLAVITAAVIRKKTKSSQLREPSIYEQ